MAIKQRKTEYHIDRGKKVLYIYTNSVVNGEFAVNVDGLIFFFKYSSGGF